MNPLSDRVLGHLRHVLAEPDFAGSRYTLESQLGRGGMGVVYAVLDQQLDRRVAMKVLDNAVEGESAAAALREEARIIAGLEHPGIIPLYDAGLLPDGRFFYTMRIAGGRRLDRWLGETPDLAERLRLFERLCETAAYAHSRGVVHCDLKPQNIMVGEFGEVFVLDWGVARRLEPGPRAAAGGTPHYMAPEQTLPGAVIDGRADVYSLGVILAGMAGPEGPRPVRAIAGKARSRSPEDRYPGALALAADVIRFRDRLPVAAYRETLPERLGRFVGRNRTLVLLLAAYVAARFLLFFLRRA